MVRGADTYRLVTDHLGSVRLVVKGSDGSVAQRIDYDEFGVVANDTAPGLQPFGFAGGLFDADTTLVRFGARDYDAETGRWTAKDPILWGGDQTNLYVYVKNDPVNKVDSSGKRVNMRCFNACMKPYPSFDWQSCSGMCVELACPQVPGAVMTSCPPNAMQTLESCFEDCLQLQNAYDEKARVCATKCDILEC